MCHIPYLVILSDFNVTSPYLRHLPSSVLHNLTLCPYRPLLNTTTESTEDFGCMKNWVRFHLYVRSISCSSVLFHCFHSFTVRKTLDVNYQVKLILSLMFSLFHNSLISLLNPCSLFPGQKVIRALQLPSPVGRAVSRTPLTYLPIRPLFHPQGRHYARSLLSPEVISGYHSCPSSLMSLQ